MPIDLSTASADGLKLILLKVPVKDLIKSCTQVSKRWNGILEDNDFWRKKMEEDGYLWQGKMCENGNKFEWKKSAGISTKLFKWIALKHCFEHNFLKDNWNLEAQYWEVLTLDPRWKAGRILQEKVDMHIDDSDRVRVEIPPKFVDDQPEIPQPIPACIAIPNFFSKYIVIKLADEGLTDEIMDNFRPTIFISEIFGNRRDCNIFYIMQCSLHATSDDVNIYDIFGYIFSQDQCGFLIERRDENGRWVRATIAKQFKQGEAEGWHRMEYALKDYPAGMRYLYLRCMGYGHRQNPEGHCGLKLAKCSVMALCEKNAPE